MPQSALLVFSYYDLTWLDVAAIIGVMLVAVALFLVAVEAIRGIAWNLYYRRKHKETHDKIDRIKKQLRKHDS